MALDRLRLTPHRPALPPLLLCGLGLWLGIALIFPFLRTVALEQLVVAFWCSLVFTIPLAALSLAFARGNRRRRPWIRGLALTALTCALCATCIAGAAIGSLTATATLAQGSREYTFELTADAKPATFGNRVEARVVDGSPRPILVELTVAGDYRTLLLGARLKAKVRLSPLNEANAAYYWQNGLTAKATLNDCEPLAPAGPFGVLLAFRGQAIGALREYGGNAAPLLEALACGYRPDLEESGLYPAFQRTGLAHLVAVSGAHLTLVSMMLLFLLTAAGAPRILQIGAVGVFALIYWVLAGFPISALRAALMTICALTSFTAARRAFPLNAIGLCVVIVLVGDPTAAFSVSFGLSVGATLGIILFLPLMLAWFPNLSNRVRDLVVSPLGLTLASSVMTQPASAALFHQVPLISPLANIVAGPLFTLACASSLLGALVGGLAPALGAWVVGAAALATMPLSLLVQWLSTWPGACIPWDGSVPLGVALSALMAAGLWLWWPVKHRRSLALAAFGVTALATFAFWMAAHPLNDEIVMLDIGQGDAFVLRSNGAAVMIDTGQRDGDLKAALARHGVTHLDALCITHGDQDHCGSMDALAQVCTVERVMLAEDALTCRCEACTDLVREAKTLAPEAVVGLTVGDELSVGRLKLKVISPETFTDEGGNADSLTMVLTADEDGDGRGEWTGLFSGDAEAEVLEGLVDKGLLGPVDVLKVAHHGSKAAVSATLLKALQPQVALVSVGANNRYGHPAEETLAALDEAGVAVWRSDEVGDVVVTLSAESMGVSGQRPKSG